VIIYTKQTLAKSFPKWMSNVTLRIKQFLKEKRSNKRIVHHFFYYKTNKMKKNNSNKHYHNYLLKNSIHRNTNKAMVQTNKLIWSLQLKFQKSQNTRKYNKNNHNNNSNNYNPLFLLLNNNQISPFQLSYLNNNSRMFPKKEH